MNKNRKVLLMLLLAVLMLVGCTPQNTQVEPKSITIIDQKDREITVTGNVEKIISLAPSCTETLFALGLGDKIVGVSEYSNYPEEAKAIQIVGGFDSPNVELIVANQPSVVFSTTMSQESVEMLDQTGIPVIVLDPKDFDSIYAGIEIMGQVCDVSDAATELINDMQSRIATIQETVEHITQEEQKMVYYEIWHDPPMTVGPNTFLNQIITFAGCVNLANDAATDWPSYSSEQILVKNPDIILLGHSGQVPEDVVNRTGWELIAAVKENHIYEVNQDIFSQPIPRAVDAIELLAKYAYPELFVQ